MMIRRAIVSLTDENKDQTGFFVDFISSFKEVAPLELFGDGAGSAHRAGCA
jgi:hypothetical protein